MRIDRATALLAPALLLAAAAGASAQESDSTSEFWPEVNVFVPLGPRARIVGTYTATRQQSLDRYADGQTGVYFDFWALPPFRKNVRDQADASRSKLLLLRTGYRFSRPKNESGKATEHMFVAEATSRFHLRASFLLSDRNRVDLRWRDGNFTWRYRNRLKVERTFSAGRFDFTPYVHGEVNYSLDQHSWTRLRYAAGMEWAVTRRVTLEGYYARQNDWDSIPQFTNAFGVVLQFYIR